MAAPPAPTHPSHVPPPSLMPAGTRLGRYEVIGELGTGGMATVYEGRALSVGGFARRVAIKYLHPHLLRDEQFVQMFMDEGRLAAGIHHPNVVAVVDLVHEPNCMYMVSEYVEGDQLLGLFKAARDAKTRIPAPIAVRIALDMLAGLHAAHELTADDGAPLRIVHRDVSPHNVLVGADGITRITDFGIAKAEERISTTRDGIVKGKLSYMAPEQPDDLPVDRRADVFSAATVLWECLAGARLFPGRTDREVLQALLHKPIPRLREVTPEVSDELDAVLVKALARSPDERYSSAAEFAEALEVASRNTGVAAPREVARYVEQSSAPKLGAERERRRAMTNKDLPAYRPGTPSEVRAVSTTSSRPPPLPATRTEPGVGPTPDPDEQPTMISAPHAIRSIVTQQGTDEGERATDVKVAAPAIAAPPVPALVLPAPPSTLVSAPPRPRPPEASRSRAAPLVLLVVLLGSVLGYGVWRLMRADASGAGTTVATPALVTATAPREPEATPPPRVVEAPAPVIPPVVVLPENNIVVNGTTTPPRVLRPRVRPAVPAPVTAPTAPEAPTAPARPAGPQLPRHI